MTNIYEWLENVHPPSCAPTSTPFVSRFVGVPTDEITLLDVDEERNMYFDVPNARSQNGPFEQSRIGIESVMIDPSLGVMTNPPMPSTPVIMIPEQLAEASRKVLIYLAQILDIPETPDDLEKEPAEGNGIHGGGIRGP